LVVLGAAAAVTAAEAPGRIAELESIGEKPATHETKRETLPLVLIGAAMLGYAVIIWQWL
jgi:hypothetical protein